MLRNYWLIAIRKLWKHKGHASINVLGLTIGLASCLIIFLITHFELGYDRFHPNGDHIYRIVTHESRPDRQSNFGSVPGPLPPAVRRDLTGFQAVSAFLNADSKVLIPGKGAGRQAKQLDPPPAGTPSPIIITDPQYFEIFQYKWLVGNPATSLNDPYRVVLSAAEVQKYFGAISPRDAIGREVIYPDLDSLRTYVSGVVQDWDQHTDLGFRDFISYSTAQSTDLKNNFHLNSWGGIGSYSQGFVLLPGGTTPAQVERQFPTFVGKYFLLPPGVSASLSLQPLTDIHFNADYTDEYSRKAHLPTLYGLMGIAVFILLLAVINFVNLSTAQSLQRAREVGIRKVLGSRRKDIVIQFLGETFVLTLLAVILSLVITPLMIALLRQWMPPGLHLELSTPTLLFLLGIIIITSLLAGWYPAKVISVLQPVLSLKGQATRNLLPNRLLHRGLIVFQFTISLVFIIGTVIVARQLHYILNKDLGFDKDAIITFRASGPVKEREVLAQQLRDVTGISTVSRHDQTPQAGFQSQTSFTYHGPQDRQADNVVMEDADTDYLRLFGIQLVAGRNFYANDSVNEYVINETLASQLGFRRPQDALGQPVEPSMSHGPGGAKGTIVGVVRDFHSGTLHTAIPPLYLDYNTHVPEISVRLAPEARQPATVAAVLSQVEHLWQTTYPHDKFSYTFFDETIANLYQQEQRISGLMRLAMIIAIAISCMGLLGLVTFAAEQRQKEIGIRKVMGASVVRIFRMLTLDFLWPVALAFVIATPVAWYFMHGWLQDFVYRTTVPWWIFGFCGLAAVAIAMLTVGFQAIRAAVRNPVESLRAE
jgi:ABC-type lipoprotein release transport system permease subunit